MSSGELLTAPVHELVSAEWFDAPPKKPGWYWFFGDPYMGSMGGHYTGTVPPDNRLSLVRVDQIANGVLAVADGHAIPLRVWRPDKQIDGVLGKWCQAMVPDTAKLESGADKFSAEPSDQASLGVKKLLKKFDSLARRGYEVHVTFYGDGVECTHIIGGDPNCSHRKYFDPEDGHGFTYVHMDDIPDEVLDSVDKLTSTQVCQNGSSDWLSRYMMFEWMEQHVLSVEAEPKGD